MFGHIKHPVRGTAQLVSYEETGKKDASETTIKAQLMIQGDGVLPTSVESDVKVSNSEMPVSAGKIWNVEFERDDPSHFKLLEGALAPVVAVAEPQSTVDMPQMIDQALDQVTGGVNKSAVLNVSGTSAPEQVVDLRGQDSEHVHDALAQVQQTYGIDLTQVVAAAQQAAAAWRSQMPGVAAPSASAPAAGTDELLSKLERLGNLHTSGVLTDAEFAAAKQKLLGDTPEPPSADPPAA